MLPRFLDGKYIMLIKLGKNINLRAETHCFRNVPLIHYNTKVSSNSKNYFVKLYFDKINIKL